jgi:hypothetical protein
MIDRTEQHPAEASHDLEREGRESTPKWARHD